MVFKESEIYSVSMSNLADLTFEDVASSGRGYDENDPQHKSDNISIREYPLVLSVATKNMLMHTNEYNLRHFSDVQRYSTILGCAILQAHEEYRKLVDIYNKASDLDDLLIQDALDNVHPYRFATLTKTNRSTFKTVVYVKEFVQEKSHILQIPASDFIQLISLVGLAHSLNSLRAVTRNNVNVEVSRFFENISIQRQHIEKLLRFE